MRVSSVFEAVRARRTPPLTHPDTMRPTMRTRMAVRIPRPPSQDQRGPKLSAIAPTTLRWVRRPINSSAIMIGRPMAAMQTR